MRIRDRLAGAWNSLLGRGAPSGSGSGGMLSGGPYHPDAYGAKRAPTPWELVEKYKSIIFFCANLNAGAVASIPLRLYSASGPGMAAPRRACGPIRLRRGETRRLRELDYLRRSQAAAEEIHEITNHPFLDLLDSPDPDGYFDRTQLLDMMVRYIDVVGTSYHRPVDYGEFPAELWPLQSQYVWPVRMANSALIAKYTYFADNYEFDQLLRIRLRPSLHDPYGAGYAAAQAATEYAGLEDQWVTIQEAVLGGGPRPGLIVSSGEKMPLGKDEGEKLEKDLNRKFARGGANRVWVNKTGLKVDTITYPPADLAGLDISNYNLERICNCFDVPPSMYTRETNLANTQAAKELHASKGVAPRCHTIASALTRFVRKYDPRLFAAFDPAVKEDEEHKTKIFDMKVRNGTMLRSEAIVEDGREPYEGSETPLVAGGLAPVPAAQAGAPAAGPDGAELPGEGTPAIAGDKVQDQALNGAQISSLVEVIQNVQAGVIPPISAIALLEAAFPGLDPKTIAAIVTPIEVKGPEADDSDTAETRPDPKPQSKPGSAAAKDGGNADDREPALEDEADDDPKRSAVFAQAAEVLQLLRSRLGVPGPGGADAVDYGSLYGPGAAAEAGPAESDAAAP